LLVAARRISNESGVGGDVVVPMEDKNVDRV
jgi:hypothetical protein